MARRPKLDKHPEAKKRALELYKQGKTVREIAEQISIEFPVEVSKSSVHRLVKHYKELLKLNDVGIMEEDVDLMNHSQQLSLIANGMITELLVEWKEKGEITSERLKAILDLLSTTSGVAKTTAQIERIKSQLIQHIEKVMQKITKAVERVIDDEETRIKLLIEIRKELEA
jgi:hypothetical protein